MAIIIDMYDIPLEERFITSVGENVSIHKHIEQATCTRGKTAYVVSVYEYTYETTEYDHDESNSMDMVYQSEKLIKQRIYRDEDKAWAYFERHEI